VNVERVTELIRPYVGAPGVVGIYVVGSATRPHRDALSDYDIEVIVEDDVYERTPDSGRQVFAFKEGESKLVDYEFYLRPWSEFERLVDSTQDLFHYPYQYAVIAHDPEGRIAPVVRRLAALPDDVRDDRMRVHYLEFLFALGRARKTKGRGGPVNLRLLSGDALAALVKLFFLTLRSWPATHHWVEQELRLLGLPEDLLRQTTDVLAAAKPSAAEELVEAVRRWLDARGETFHREREALIKWAFHRREGRRAFEVWASR
jgi:predicted nucleotidyltransferase